MELSVIIWLDPWLAKMNRILYCDWLPERARWSSFARSGRPAVSRKEHYPESYIVNPLLTKLVRSRWLDIGIFGEFMDRDLANIQPSWPRAWTITHRCQLNIKAWKSQLAPEGRSVGYLQTWPRSWTRFYQERTPAKRSERDFRISSRAP